MKKGTLEDYAARIDRAVQHLAAQLQQDRVPGLAELAEAAAMSKFHFHRVFRLMTGETVQEAVRRVRLAKGSAAMGSASITHGAAEAAYATSQAFARAMRSATGMSATEMLRQPQTQSFFAAPVSRAPLAVELVSVDPLEVIAIRTTGSHDGLDQVFGRLFEIAGGPEAVQGIYGVYHSDPRLDPPGETLFDAALLVSPMPLMLGEAQCQTLPGGRFIRMRHLGDYDLIPLAMDELTLRAMSGDGFDLRDAPPFVHYLDDPEECSVAELRSDVFVPVSEARADSAR